MKYIKNILVVLSVLSLLSVFGACNKSGNIDSLLDKYEEIVDKTISISNKVKSGDYGAMSELTELQSQYREFGEKLEKARSEGMTPAQLSRFQKIAGKLVGAL